MPTEVDVKVTALVPDTVSMQVAFLFQRPPEFVKKYVPLPGATLALVAYNTGSCTLVGLST